MSITYIAQAFLCILNEINYILFRIGLPFFAKNVWIF